MLYIKNGRIKTMAGAEYPNGQILIENGKIKAVGENVEKPEGAEEIDAGGHLVTPGMIDAHCHIGRLGSALRWEGEDANEEMDPIPPIFAASTPSIPWTSTRNPRAATGSVRPLT